MNLWKSMSGIVEVELTSADIAQSMEVLRTENITIFHLKRVSDLTATFEIYRRDYHALSKICEKRGQTVKLTKRKGIYWSFRIFLMRPVLCIGLFILIFSALIIPQYVLFVEIEGNETVPDNRIIEAAEECGICFGASRRQVRSESIKNDLLSKIPELQWAGVNTRGCVAIIRVREGAEIEAESDRKVVSSIIADRDGIIISCTATKGSLQCTQGQAVRAGELLISGYTDCGISIQATQAQGEIYAQTIRELTVISPRDYSDRVDSLTKKYNLSILVGKKRINLWKDSGIWTSTCGRMYKEYYMTLPGGFVLPIALCVDTYVPAEVEPNAFTAEEASLRQFAKQYLTEQMVAGNILESKESISTEACQVLRGSYLCTEMIGRRQPEKMGE